MNNPESQEAKDACAKVLSIFHETSCLVIKDPRVQSSDNAEFIDMMEDYYNLPFEVKKKDARPEASFQVGSTPEFTEVPRDNSSVIEKLGLSGENAPVKPDGADPKWRFFWPVGERPLESETKFPVLNHKNVVPEGFPQWTSVMEKWGGLMLGAVRTVAEMIALGSGLERDAFTSRMNKAPHLLAPTGSNIGEHNKLGTVFAGFHYDLNFITIHGKSRYPGLYIWLRNGTKVPVKVPDGCLLLQAGKQLEWLTGSYITAGYHEVIVNENTLQALERQREAGRPLWRVSSTLFSHIASDVVLEPLKPEWKELDKNGDYPPTLTGDQVNQELQAINLQK